MKRHLRTKPRAEESKCCINRVSERETAVELPWAADRCLWRRGAQGGKRHRRQCTVQAVEWECQHTSSPRVHTTISRCHKRGHLNQPALTAPFIFCCCGGAGEEGRQDEQREAADALAGVPPYAQVRKARPLGNKLGPPLNCKDPIETILKSLLDFVAATAARGERGREPRGGELAEEEHAGEACWVTLRARWMELEG